MEAEIEKVLPNAGVFLLDHGALNLDRNITNFANQGLVCSVYGLDSLEDCLFDLVASSIRETLPKVLIVLLVGQIRGVNSFGGDVSANNNSSKGLSFC